MKQASRSKHNQRHDRHTIQALMPSTQASVVPETGTKAESLVGICSLLVACWGRDKGGRAMASFQGSRLGRGAALVSYGCSLAEIIVTQSAKVVASCCLISPDDTQPTLLMHPLLLVTQSEQTDQDQDISECQVPKKPRTKLSQYLWLSRALLTPPSTLNLSSPGPGHPFPFPSF